MDKKSYDFCGWASKNDMLCSDGVIIRHGAFAHNDGKKVPLMWDHTYGLGDVLGHVILQHRDQGVYAYGYFNGTSSGIDAKEMVKHGDVVSMSILANQLTKVGRDVKRGDIKEVSLVLAGANPGAMIEEVLEHSDSEGSTAFIWTGDNLRLEDDTEFIKHSEDTDDDETVEDVYNSMTDKQKLVCDAMAIAGMQSSEDEDDEYDEYDEDSEDEDYIEQGEDLYTGGKRNMKKNVFDRTSGGDIIRHTVDFESIKAAATVTGSLRTAITQYDNDNDEVISHGMTNLELLFPDAGSIANVPEFVGRDQTWVQIVLNGVHHTPFSKVRTLHADITEDEARAKGYIKGNLKKEEVFSLLKRVTSATTVYKKQKMERDDHLDIIDFDVIAWLKVEMRMMLDEEIARAILVGDSRVAGTDDKIDEGCIRPIWKDSELYSVHTLVELAAGTTEAAKAEKFIDATILSRKDYKGSGNPIMFIEEDLLTRCLLLKDTTGRFIYESAAKLAQVLRVSEIVPVPVIDNLTREDGGKTKTLGAIIVALKDYNVGADKGGAVAMFDDFDINYNKEIYLIETRCSGALTKAKSALVIEFTTAIAG